MSRANCIGIDIGMSSVKIAVKARGKIRKVISQSLPQDLVKDRQIVSYDAMGDFLREVLKNNRIKTKHAQLALPIHSCYIRTVTLPAMNVQQLKVNLPYEFHDFISEDMDQYMYDYKVLQQGPDSEGQLHLLAVAAEKKMITGYMQMARRAKIRLDIMAPVSEALGSAIAAFSSARGIPAGQKDFALVDIGGGAVNIHFFTRGVYEVTRQLDIGMDAVLERLADESGSDLHIERVNFEADRDQVQSSEIAEDEYGTIIAQITRVLNFYNFNNRDNNLEELYYYGGGALVRPFLSQMSEAIPLKMASAAELLPESMKCSDSEVMMGFQAISVLL